MLVTLCGQRVKTNAKLHLMPNHQDYLEKHDEENLGTCSVLIYCPSEI